MKNRKAAIGATMTWIVATIIILVVVIIFVYAAKVQSAGSIKGSFTRHHELTEISKEQMLLALLETEVGGEIEGMKVKHYLISEDYGGLEEKIKPILDKFPLEDFPGSFGGNWIFIIYKDGKKEFQVGKTYSRDINPSIVYFSDKKIELRVEYEPLVKG